MTWSPKMLAKLKFAQFSLPLAKMCPRNSSLENVLENRVIFNFFGPFTAKLY